MERKSGKHWVEWATINAPNSNSLISLSYDFRPKVEEFIKALAKGGAMVKIQTTKRSSLRAYLFHWAWLIGLEKIKPSEAKQISGIDILWDHGNHSASINGAKEMIQGFGLAVPPKSTVAPSLWSNHIAGKAIDMDIIWAHRIRVKRKDNKEVDVMYMADPNTNSRLIELGQSYGVFKHMSDAPHWSYNGR